MVVVGLGASWYEPGEMSAVAVLARGQTKSRQGVGDGFSIALSRSCLCADRARCSAVFALSRLKRGFDSPRERQLIKDLLHDPHEQAHRWTFGWTSDARKNLLHDLCVFASDWHSQGSLRRAFSWRSPLDPLLIRPWHHPDGYAQAGGKVG